MGKMTNALEKVVDAFYEGRNEDALQLFYKIKNYHLDQLKYLITLQWQKATNQLNDFFTEVEWLLHDKPVKVTTIIMTRSFVVVNYSLPLSSPSF